MHATLDTAHRMAGMFSYRIFLPQGLFNNLWSVEQLEERVASK
jgi:hypothetical protein